ncbi:hypothetical protein BG015_004027 [Linnemannia schmuckeri]|uniref:D-arabinono-1,4-lactone oxidase C-terminal domain-containing protein n=1 Tax=Linnemannia schmuckeri TaxID=64567 RepID=A0A9P5S2T2_9FUNG|nr:hypothetical protein BG015_004027 [Linnemannia schmuckeri]
MTTNIVMGEHGAATHSRTLSDLACEVKIMDSTGTLNTFTREKDPIEFSAAACNFGLLGVIYSYTLRVEPTFKLAVSDSYPRLIGYFSCPKQGGARLKKMVAQTDQSQFFFWVFDGHYSRSTAWKSMRIVRQYLSCFIGGILLKTMVSIPRMTPLIKCGISKASRSGFAKVQKAPDEIHYQHNIEDMVCVGVECVFKVDERFERPSEARRFAISRIYEYAACGKYLVNMIMDMRFIKSSDQIMSYVYDKDPKAIYCTIEILSTSKTKGFNECTTMLAQHWVSEYQARPHWMKLWEHISGTVLYLREKTGPRPDQFESIRKKYDPQGIFMNRIFAGVLGH